MLHSAIGCLLDCGGYGFELRLSVNHEEGLVLHVELNASGRTGLYGRHGFAHLT